MVHQGAMEKAIAHKGTIKKVMVHLESHKGGYCHKAARHYLEQNYEFPFFAPVEKKIFTGRKGGIYAAME